MEADRSIPTYGRAIAPFLLRDQDLCCRLEIPRSLLRFRPSDDFKFGSTRGCHAQIQFSTHMGFMPSGGEARNNLESHHESHQ